MILSFFSYSSASFPLSLILFLYFRQIKHTIFLFRMLTFTQPTKYKKLSASAHFKPLANRPTFCLLFYSVFSFCFPEFSLLFFLVMLIMKLTYFCIFCNSILFYLQLKIASIHSSKHFVYFNSTTSKLVYGFVFAKPILVTLPLNGLK